MSAIWGANKNNPTKTQMTKVYNEKYFLDKIEVKSFNNSFAGCGVQNADEVLKDEMLPIVDDEKKCLFTSDCIIDNRQELLDSLSISDKNVSDGFIMYKAYERWGSLLGRHVRGLFSFACIYEDKVVLGVDPVGGRCLYYYKNDNDIIFSTVIEPILNAVSDIKINKNYIYDYIYAPGMMPNIVPEESAYEGILKVLPGTTITFEKNKITQEEYWSLDNPVNTYKFKSKKAWVRAFKKLFERCVSDAIGENKKVAISLSSGLDSSSIACLAAKKLGSNGKVEAFTYVPYEEPTKTTHKNFVLDEKKEVLDICKKYTNIENHFLNNQGKNAISELENTIRIMEMPVKAFVNIPNLIEIYNLAAQKGCKRILVGQFGNSTVSHGEINDVLFSLYEEKKYLTFLQFFNSYCKHERISSMPALKKCIGEYRCLEKKKSNKDFDYEITNQFLNKKIKNDYPLRQRFIENGIDTFSYFPEDASDYKSNMKRKASYTYIGEMETKLGLATGIIVRDPTKDIRLLEFCYQMPFECFAHMGTPRCLIRKNFEDMLPDKILNNWSRYGLQNADWHIRVKRDWNELEGYIFKLINDSAKTIEIDKAKVDDLFNQIYSMESEELDNGLTQLVFICNVGLFVK